MYFVISRFSKSSLRFGMDLLNLNPFLFLSLIVLLNICTNPQNSLSLQQILMFQIQ